MCQFQGLQGEFTHITSERQKKKYVKIFEKGQKVYKKLHARVEREVNKFVPLEAQLNSTPQNTPEYQVIADLIRSLYYEMAEEAAYQVILQRFRDLHAKLKLIKNLLDEYNQNAQFLLEVANLNLQN